MNGMSLADRNEMMLIRDLAKQALGEIQSHEEVCLVRQGNIQAELKTIRWVLITIALSLIGALATTLLNLLIHFPPNH